MTIKLSLRQSYSFITCIETKQSFEAASMSGEPVKGGYIIRSYAEPIAFIMDEGSAVVSRRKFSQTTSRHQGIVRRMCLENGIPFGETRSRISGDGDTYPKVPKEDAAFFASEALLNAA